MTGRSVAGVLVAALFAAGLAGLSRVPWTFASDGPASELRLSWRAPAPLVERCRPPTEAELAGLPAHMRPQEICEGGSVPFQLTIAVDGTELRNGTVSGASDRTVFVYETYALPPGEHEVVVTFGPDAPEARQPGDSTASGEGRVTEAGRTLPPTVRFHERIRFTAGRARLITLGPAGLSVDGTG